MSAAPVPAALLTQDFEHGARIRRLLRLLLVAFFVGVLLTEPPSEHALSCWGIVGAYLAWTLALGAVLRTQPRLVPSSWRLLFVDVVVLTALTLVSDLSADQSWAPFLLLNAFFLIPVMAATQLSPRVCAAVVVPTVGVYLLSALLIRDSSQEPASFIVLRTAMLATVSLGAYLLTRLQRRRVSTISGLLTDRTALLTDRTALLTELVSLQQREQRDLAETLHDGALQYVLGARLELDDALEGDPVAAARLEEALDQSARLLRSTMSQLHPAVLDHAGLASAMSELIDSVRTRGSLTVELETDGWGDDLRTDADELLLMTARELLTNVLKHAAAGHVRVTLSRSGQGAQSGPRQSEVARLTVADDGRGMSDVDLAARLSEGHLGLASRRIRIEAAGGSMTVHGADPHGTVIEVSVPI